MCNILVWNSCGLISPPSSDLRHPRHRILFVTSSGVHQREFTTHQICITSTINVSLSVHQESIMFGLHIMIINVLFLNKFLIFKKKNHFTSKITYLVIIHVNILNVYFLLLYLQHIKYVVCFHSSA